MHIDLNYLASSTRSEICPVSYVMIFVYKQVTASMSTMSYAPYQVYIAQETLRINATLIFDTVFLYLLPFANSLAQCIYQIIFAFPYWTRILVRIPHCRASVQIRG